MQLLILIGSRKGAFFPQNARGVFQPSSIIFYVTCAHHLPSPFIAFTYKKLVRFSCFIWFKCPVTFFFDDYSTAVPMVYLCVDFC